MYFSVLTLTEHKQVWWLFGTLRLFARGFGVLGPCAAVSSAFCARNADGLRAP